MFICTYHQRNQCIWPSKPSLDHEEQEKVSQRPSVSYARVLRMRLEPRGNIFFSTNFLNSRRLRLRVTSGKNGRKSALYTINTVVTKKVTAMLIDKHSLKACMVQDFFFKHNGYVEIRVRLQPRKPFREEEEKTQSLIDPVIMSYILQSGYTSFLSSLTN